MSNDMWDWDDDMDDGPYTRLKIPAKEPNFNHPISQPDTIKKFVNQTKYWVNREGAEIRIKDMDKDYIYNVIKYLHKRRDELVLTLNFLEPEPSIETTAISTGTFASAHIPMLSLIEDTPLYKKLVARYRKLVS